MTDDRPLGKRFTHVYAERGTPVDDSPRMRARLASVLADLGSDISQIAERKLGLQTPWSTSKPWRTILSDWDISDVLDVITIVYGHLRSLQANDRYGTYRRVADDFLGEVREIFDEENLHYELDAKGGVHYRLDEEFSRAKSATIAALKGKRYANALDAFDRGIAELSKPVPDGKHAIRASFAAIEGLFRLMHPGSPRLTGKEAEKLRPSINASTTGNAAASGAAAKALESFKDWIDAAHFYRHEPGTPEVAQPPIALAVYLVSTGAAHLRWLAEIDQSGGEGVTFEKTGL